MNIRTIKDVHPEDIYVMPHQYKAIRHAKSGKSFEIKDNQIAQQLIVLDLVKKEEVRAWAILIIALAALGLSILSLYIQYLDYIAV